MVRIRPPPPYTESQLIELAFLLTKLTKLEVEKIIHPLSPFLFSLPIFSTLHKKAPTMRG
ncbi:hypothetical protein, partial [Vibrio cholerae]|uniref:hypothetical protein n=1 Tax=Vibrio cholerae TaxID=666 RepID=UPI00050C1007